MIKLKVLHVTGALVGLSLLAGAWSGIKGPRSVRLATNLIGMKVVSQDGDSLGKIEDVVVHPGGETLYAVLSFGEWMGTGEKLFAMPWTVLRTVEPDTAKQESARSLVLPLDKERLKTAPGFDKQSWPVLANLDWTKDVDAFYVGAENPNTVKPVDASARTTVITGRAAELKGTDVKTPTGQSLGEVREIAIGTNGRVSYVTLSVGGFLGMGDTLVAVPWDSLRITLGGKQGDKKLITLASAKQQLEVAPEFKTGPENNAEMCDSRWVSRIYEHLSCPAY